MFNMSLKTYQDILDKLSEYHKTMRDKYHTEKWDSLCTEEEWSRFMELVRKKDKLQSRLDKEET